MYTLGRMKKGLNILAIETSCDETAAAVVRDGKILSNIVASQAKLHAKFGGVVPEVAAREHVPAMIPTIGLALKEASIKLSDIDYMAVTQGPGLMTSLLVGIDTAKTLATVLKKPLIPINHLEAHIYANFIQESRVRNQESGGLPKFPALILIVSGGHTLLVNMKRHGQYEIIGETVDDAAGEAFDKTAKLIGLGYPGGPQISKHAEQGSPTKFNFPRPMLNNPGFNFSFSGLKTAVLYEFVKQKKTTQLINDMSASLQQAVIDTLIGKLSQAIKKYHPKTIMLGGGVAANALLRKQFEKLAKQNKLSFSIPKFEYCTDNAGMIGLAAYYRLLNKRVKATTKFSPMPQMTLK